MFADDINVLISDRDERSFQTKIDRVVAELETWFNRKDLIINEGKTRVMLFHNRQTHFLVTPLVTFHKMTVDYTAEIEFLGIQIIDTLRWHSHIQLVPSKLDNHTHTYMHAYIHTYIHTYIHVYIQADRRTHIRTCQNCI